MKIVFLKVSSLSTATKQQMAELKELRDALVANFREQMVQIRGDVILTGKFLEEIIVFYLEIMGHLEDDVLHTTGELNILKVGTDGNIGYH